MSTDSKLPPEENARAGELLRAYFDTTLDRAARESAPPGFDDVTAYVEGTLDEAEREIFESRLEDDPVLRAEVEDLRALREGMRDSGDEAERETPAAPEMPVAQGAATNVRAFPVSASKGNGAASRRAWMFLSAAAIAASLAGVTWVVMRPTQPPMQPPAQSQSASGAGSTTTPVPSATSAPTPAPTPGSTAVGAPSAEAIVALHDGGRVISVDAAGKMSGLSDDSPLPADIVAQALTAGALPRPGAGTDVLAGLTQRELTLMGAADANQKPLIVISPIATVVRTTRPVFRWTPHPGARAYTVTIYSEDFEKVLASAPMQDTTWTATKPLTPGRTYQWQVTADLPDGPIHAPAPPASDARFRVLDKTAAAALDRDLARAGSSRLLAGLLFARAGVMDDAEQAFTALLAENRNNTQVTRLLTELRKRRTSDGGK